MHRRTLTLAVVAVCLALASPGFAAKKEGKGKGGGTLEGEFKFSFAGDMEANVTEFEFTYRPGDRRLLLPGFILSLDGFADKFFEFETDSKTTETYADECFPGGAPLSHDVLINRGGKDGSFIEYNETDDVIRFVGSFSALAKDGNLERDRHYILILEDSESASKPFCRLTFDADVNFIPELGTTCTGVFTSVNLRSHQKRLDKISEACVTGAGESKINVIYSVSQL